MGTFPKLRIAGFTDAWEQRKVLDVAPLQRGFDLPASQMEGGDYPVVMSNGIGGYHNVYKVRGPGVVTGRSGTIGRVHYVETGYWPHNTSLWVTDFKGNEPKFIYHLYQWLDLSRFGTGSGVPTLNRNDVHDSKVSMPSYDEQLKISKFLDGFDNLITLHQRKCDALKIAKKYFLQNMFPSEGERFPKIRLAGFTDAWEQRKLGEIFSQTVNYVNPKTKNLELWSLTVQDGLTQKTERYNREFITKKDDKYKEVKVGEIVYNPMNMTLGAIDVNNVGKSVAVSGYYVTMVASESTYPYFIQTWMKSPQAILLYKNNATGTLKEKQRIQFTTLSKITSVIPSKAEQEKIGSFFSNLDNLITLHQRKCDALKNAKKFFLQNMFV